MLKRNLIALAGLSLVASFSLSAHAQEANRPTHFFGFRSDSAASTNDLYANLYTSYNIASYQGTSNLYWVTCGATQQSEGCYASGSLTLPNNVSYKRICAMMEGPVSVKGNVYSHSVYVLDGGLKETDKVELSVFEMTDTISPSDDTGTATFVKTINLSPTLLGGSKASCYMAANPVALYVGTSEGPTAVSVSKTNLAVNDISEFAQNISQITADSRGYVIINFGNTAFPSGQVIIAPNGAGEGDGGGNSVVLNTTNAVLPVP